MHNLLLLKSQGRLGSGLKPSMSSPAPERLELASSSSETNKDRPTCELQVLTWSKDMPAFRAANLSLAGLSVPQGDVAAQATTRKRGSLRLDAGTHASFELVMVTVLSYIVLFTYVLHPNPHIQGFIWP